MPLHRPALHPFVRPLAGLPSSRPEFTCACTESRIHAFRYDARTHACTHVHMHECSSTHACSVLSYGSVVADMSIVIWVVCYSHNDASTFDIVWEVFGHRLRSSDGHSAAADRVRWRGMLSLRVFRPPPLEAWAGGGPGRAAGLGGRRALATTLVWVSRLRPSSMSEFGAWWL